MIRCRHQIDTKLVTFFISENKFDTEINEALINWYTSLEDKNHQNSRKSAIEFLKILSRKVLTEIDYPLNEREKLVKIFDPLELVLRTALSIKQPGEGQHYVRDHLSHTVRNVLFTNFLLKKYDPENYSSLRMQLFITAIFHDLAYPIEKIKAVAKKIGGSTFTELLNSKGEIEIELENPHDLLEVLNYFGKLIGDLIKEQEHADDDLKEKLQIRVKKIELIYRKIVSEAIAGKGLFDASHSISSVVLFLMPIIKYWQNSRSYHEINLDSIADICLAMAYHDRINLVQEITEFKIPLILKVMRLADELQEWDRESDSFILDATIEKDISAVLSFKLIMRDKTKSEENNECKAEYFLPDKINGILPIVTDDEKIKLYIEFPRKIDKDKVVARFEKKVAEPFAAGPIKLNYEFTGHEKGNKIEIVFHNRMATLQIKKSTSDGAGIN